MTQIGASWDGSKTDKNGNTYFIITPDKNMTPFIVDGSKLWCFKQNTNAKSDKAPKWILDSFIPVPKEERTKNELLDEEEVPF